MEISNRIVVKWVRDLNKSKIITGTHCLICDTKDKLEVHHYQSVGLVLRKWMKDNNKLDKDVLDWRQEFIDSHNFQLVDDVVTLCNKHHKHLHNLFGESPPLHTVEKQKRWVLIQKDKYGKLVQ